MRPPGGPVPDSIPALLEHQAQVRPQDLALGAPGGRFLTFRELSDAVAVVTERLNALGFGPGTRIAIVLPGGSDLALTVLGVAAGAVAVPLDPRLTATELGARFAALGVTAVLVGEGLGSAARVAARTARLPVIELTPRVTGREARLSLRGAAARAPVRGRHATPDAVALVLQTSGTTGAPKAVRLRHRQLCASARNVATVLALTPADRCLGVMPLFHVHGLVGALLASLGAGSSIALSPGFSALRFFTWLEEARPTWYTAAPAMHQAIARLAATSGARRGPGLGIRLARSSSAALAPAVMAELEGLFDAPVIEAYGMTEAAHQITSNPLPPATRKPGSVGLPVGVELAIRDEVDTLLAPGRVGEIAVSGDTISAAPEAAGEPSSGGWLETGDAGFLDPDGYLVITGRLSEAINRGGEKIFPQEVDAALLAHPAVADVAAVPVPDARLGEDVGALVVLHPGARATVGALRAFVAERVAPFKVPRWLEVVRAIPREATGKVARRRLGESIGVDLAARTRAPGAPSAASPGSALPARLLAFVREHLAERGGWFESPLTEDTSLIRSGLFDSLALVDLVHWVEREAGEPFGTAEARLVAECDTVRDLVGFLGARRSTPARARHRRRAAVTTLPGYRFEAYRPAWRDGLLELQQHHWGPDGSANAALFEWKYEMNPYAADPLVYVALHGDRVVGMRGFWAGLWRVGRRRRVFPALAGGDLVVSPAHRDRGIVHGIMTCAHGDLARRGYELLLSFSAGRRTYLASLVTGWRPLAPLGVRRRQDASSPRREDVFAELDDAAQRPPALPVSIDRAPRPGAMLAVLDRLPRDARLHQVRDERYLGWRYGNPISRYRFLFWEEAQARGYLVLQTSLRQRSGRGSRVNVIEWEATGARARDGLLRCALEWGAFPEVRVWAASLPRSARRLLRDLGFRPLVGRRGVSPHPSAVLARLLGRRAMGLDRWVLGGCSLGDSTSWDLRMACSDAV